MGARRPARALLAAAVLCRARPRPRVGSALSRPADAEARAALDLVYDGDFHGAEARLAALAREHPDDPVLPYLQALALEWRLEQDPASRAHDAEVLALADRALGLADAQLGRDPGDARALLARGAAHGVKSRLHLFRWEKGPASREAVRMREALARRAGRGRRRRSTSTSASGSTTTTPTPCPRFFKLVAFVLRIPGGDRERGLERVARVARGGSLFHDDEARVQMYDIHSYFERKPDRALHWIREMWRLHPGWPIWGLKLAQLLGEPMGLWAAERRRRAGDRSPPRRRAATRTTSRWWRPWRGCSWRRRSSATCASRRPARRPAARARARPGRRGSAERAERVLARCLDLERRAGSPEARALALLAQARRLRERGDEPSAEAACRRAFQSYPRERRGRASARPGRACAAGRPAAARELARAVLEGEGEPWLRPFARLVLARALESEGARARALDALPPRVGGAARAGGAARRGGRRRSGASTPATALPDAPPLER